MSKPISLQGFANAAARYLPLGWELELTIEQNSGSVVLYDERGVEHDFAGNDLGFDGEAQAAVDFAREHEGFLEPVDWDAIDER